MEAITYYKSFDGKIFETKEECSKYEEITHEENKLIEQVNKLKRYCSVRSCSECIFCDITNGECRLNSLLINRVSENTRRDK